MGSKSLAAVGRSSSILDYVSSQANSPLTETQALTDQLVSVSIQEDSNLKTAAAMLGAGWVGRATRMGAMISLPGQTLLTQGIRWGSYVPALAGESAAFAGIERGFHPSTQSFQKQWAQAAVTLTGLKLFGGISRGQNIVLQHLFTDLGLVGSQHAASAVGLTGKSQGNFARQMLEAEAINWQMKGSLAFAHSLSPHLLATEKSLDIYLSSQKTGLFSGEEAPFLSQAGRAMEGAPGVFLANSKAESKETGLFRMSDTEGNGGSRKGAGGPDPHKQSDSIKRRFALMTRLLFEKGPMRAALENLLLNDPDPVTRMTAAESLGVEHDLEARPALERALNDSSQEVREAAKWALKRLSAPLGEGTVFGKKSDRPITRSADLDSIKESFALATLQLLTGGRPIRSELEEILLYNPSANSRRQAAKFLGYLRDSSSHPALTQALTDPSQEVRLAAIEALGRLRPSHENEGPLLVEDKAVSTVETLDPMNARLETKDPKAGGPSHRSWGRKLLDLVTENPPPFPVSSAELDYLTTLPSSYRPSRGVVIEKVFAHLETLRAGLERGTWGRRKFTEEYERTVGLLPKNDPVVRDEIQRELERVRGYLNYGRGLKGKAHLEIYRILLASLPDGDPFLDAETGSIKEHFIDRSARLCLFQNRFGLMHDFALGRIDYDTLQENRAQILEAHTVLLERYPLGDPRAVEEAAWLEGVLSHTNYRERNLYPQAQNAYLRALERLPLDHPEGVRTYREAWRTSFEASAKVMKGYRIQPPLRVVLSSSDRIMKALEPRLSQKLRLEIKAEPLEDPPS